VVLGVQIMSVMSRCYLRFLPRHEPIADRYETRFGVWGGPRCSDVNGKIHLSMTVLGNHVWLTISACRHVEKTCVVKANFWGVEDSVIANYCWEVCAFSCSTVGTGALC
jgi:hypothetical protein